MKNDQETSVRVTFAEVIVKNDQETSVRVTFADPRQTGGADPVWRIERIDLGIQIQLDGDVAATEIGTIVRVLSLLEKVPYA